MKKEYTRGLLVLLLSHLLSLTAFSDNVGSPRTSFNLTPTGGASYSIDIDMPKGVNGMVPSIAVSYNSQSGNGLAGYGFSISGISAITRGPRTVLHDGTASGLSFSTTDALYLDGKRLLIQSGAEGQDGAVYQPEGSSLTTVTLHNSTAQETSWFEVATPDGMRYVYGGSSSRYITYQSSQRVVAAWYIDTASDPQDNQITYSYIHDGGSLLPSSVIYGQNGSHTNLLRNTVSFEYETRPDTVTSYLGTMKIQLTKRLKRITVSEYYSSQVYRTYDFAYSPTLLTNAGYSVLSQVTEKGGSGAALRPVILEWTAIPTVQETPHYPSVDLSETSGWTQLNDESFHAADMNGDGVSDIIQMSNSSGGNIYVFVFLSQISSGSVTFPMQIAPAVFTGQFDYPMMKSLYSGSTSTDYNGDGFNDIVIPQFVVEGFTRYVVFHVIFGGRNSTMSTHVANHLLYSTSTCPLTACLDIDNDGKGDFLVLEKECEDNAYQILLYNNNGNTWSSSTLSLSSTPEKLYTADFNGDGMTDLMAVHTTGYTIFWNGGGTMPFSSSSTKTGTSVLDAKHLEMGDFNGDGYPDFLSVVTGDNQLYLSYGLGDGSFSNRTSAGNFGITDKSTDKDDTRMSCLVHDLDHDGRSDVVIEKTDYSGSSFTKTRTVWLRSVGSGFSLVKEATSTREDDGTAGHFTLGDFNGDGSMEVMNYGYDCFNGVNANVSPSLRYYTMSGYTADCGKLTSVTDGYGNGTAIQYAPLPTGGIYTPYSDAVSPMADINLPLQVVKRTVAGNGAAGDITTDYTYGGMKVHTAGRGILGFSMMRSDTGSPHYASMQTVRDSWNAEFSVPLRSTVTTGAGGETSTAVTQQSLVKKTNSATGSKIFFTYVSSVSETDFDGHVTTTANTYNTTYGYLTSQQVSDDGGSMYRRTAYSGYVKKGGAYRPQTVISTQKHSDDGSTSSSETRIAYTNTGLRSSVSSYYGTPKVFTTSYTYDYYGNMTSELSSGSGVPHTTRYYQYSKGRDLQRTYTSPATAETEYTYNAWGSVLTEQDKTNASDILTTTHTYDTWGRPLTTVEPTGVTTTRSYSWGSTAERKYNVYSKRGGEPWTRTWYDSRGRETLSETVGPKGVSVKRQTLYNNRGQVSGRITTTGTALTLTENCTYDGRGRMLSDNFIGGRQTSYTYGDRSVTTVTGGQSFTRTFDAWGNVISSTDPVSEVEYTYFSNGMPASAAANGHTVSMTYDAAGNRTELDDPDAGTTTYVYDSAGHLLSKTDGRGYTVNYVYDSLGRLSQEWTDDDQTDYTYGTAGNAKLRVTEIERDGSTVAYGYDRYGRVVSETRTLSDGTTLPFTYSYNDSGLPAQTVYPGSLTVGYTYDANGFMTAMTAAGSEVWSMTNYQGYQQNTVVAGTPVQTMFDNHGRMMAKIKSGPQDYLNHPFTFAYDASTGNVTSRMSVNGGLQTEQFGYDGLDRLTSVTMPSSSYSSMAYLASVLGISVEQAVNRFAGPQYEAMAGRGEVAETSAVTSSTPAMTVSYDDCGNIISKTGIGDYDYDGIHPHAVTSVDNTAGLIPTAAQSVSYNYYGKVQSINDGSYRMTFSYGPDDERWKTVLKLGSTVKRTTVYGGDYEKVTENGTTKEFYFIGNDVLVVKSGGTFRAYCLWTDNLGTVQQILNGSHVDAFYAKYDAWGNQTVTRDSIGFHRGYTGHEMLPEFGLINMNGRLYDPRLGRFLSPDNYVQMPDLSQSFNRYSYCLNNPLKYNDPSGEWFGLDDLLIAGSNFVFGYVFNGISSGNWGWNSVKKGLLSAATSWIAYNTAGLSSPNGLITNSTWNSLTSTGVSNLVNTFMPPVTIPINNHFGLSFSPAFGFAEGDLTSGLNLSLYYANGDVDIAFSYGVSNFFSGYYGHASYDGWGFGYGRTSYSPSKCAGADAGHQTTASFGVYFHGDVDFKISNDLWGDGKDRWRTHAAELTIGKYSVGSYIVTNYGEKEGGSSKTGKKAPWPVGRNLNKGFDAWENGRVYSAPLWIGYKSNGRVTRLGVSYPVIQNLTQNLVHKGFGKAPFYLNYEYIRRGPYAYSGFDSPISIFNF